ncbi:MAG: hypothetical protein JXJ22_01655 [Bacteroidales bacterium]|nr:hypothetical protein [Bacteroidales bacterium]
MIPFEKIRLDLAGRILKKRLKKVFRQKKVFNFNNAENAGIIFTSENETDWLENKPFIEFLNEKKIKVTVLVFLKNKKLVNYYSQLQKINYFTKKGTSLFFIPNDEHVVQFYKKEFDLLIDLSMVHNFQLSFITAMSRAHFKVGLRNEINQYYDFMIDLGNIKNKEVYFNQLKHYLSIIN